MYDSKILHVVVFSLLSLVMVESVYGYDANDFVTEVIDYDEGTDVGVDFITGEPFNDANTVLGRPTLETTGDGTSIDPAEIVPLVPVYPAFRSFEIVTIGNDGYLTLKFNHRVSDDKNNLYGMDFIIFGNSKQSSDDFWTNGNPEDSTLTSLTYSNPGIVSISQDGETWYYFSSGPYADTYAPTGSYEWDDVNDVWADELDPTRPFDPNLGASDMADKTVAEMIEAYDGSAGGTGFDINDLDPNDYAALTVDANTGVRWIQYVRIEDKPGSSATTEIDAVSDVSSCGDYKHPFPVGDLNSDCRVNHWDLEILANYWQSNISGPEDAAQIADIYDDEIINLNDFSLFGNNWLLCNWECE